MRSGPPTRRRFHRELVALEASTLDGLDQVGDQLRRAIEAVVERDDALAELVVAGDDRIDARYLNVHARLVTLVAREAPVAGDLRLVITLLQVLGDVERMGDQCVNVAKLVLLDDGTGRVDLDVLEDVEEMGRLAASEIQQAHDAFAERDVAAAAALAARDRSLDRLNGRVFRDAWDAGDDSARRAWALRMVLVARALERIGDNAVDIARNAIYLVTGRIPPRPHIAGDPAPGALR